MKRFSSLSLFFFVVCASAQALPTTTDADLPHVTFQDVEVMEPDHGSINVTLTLTASAAFTGSVQWQTVDREASAPAHDYQPGNATIQFENQSTATLVIPVYGDRNMEPNERFTIRFSNPVGLELDHTDATIWIIDNDVYIPPPEQAIIFNPSSLSLYSGESAVVETATANATLDESNMTVALHATNETVAVPATVQVPGTLIVTASSPGTAEVQCDGDPGRCAPLVIEVLAPALLALSPGRAPTSGGVEVALRGAGFSNGCNVAFGGVSSTSRRLVDRQTMIALAPPHVPGFVNVTVTCGMSTLTLPNALEYVSAVRQRSVRH